MVGKVFINYRRDDAAADAGRLYDALSAKLGKTRVFMDVDRLRPGQRFDLELAKALTDCDVLLAVIGPQWLQLLRVRAKSGGPDYVRKEIAGALERGIVVIPVRVGREGRLPPIPSAEDLPEDLRELVLHQKQDVVHESAGRDIEALAKIIQQVQQRKPSGRKSRVLAIVAAMASVIAVGMAWLALSASSTGNIFVKCDMSTGIMNGKTYSFAFNLPTRTVEWADYGVKLDVVALDDTILNTNVQMSISGWPPHDEILFNFNRVKMTVEGLIGKKQTSDDVEKCKSQAKGAWLDYCGMPIVVGSSVGQCKLIERLL